MVEHFLFFRIVGAKGVNRHFNAVDDRFSQADQGPDSSDTDTTGADEADFLSPDGLSKGSRRLAFSRSQDRGQVGNEDVPGQEGTD